jgi:hypothetical protein
VNPREQALCDRIANAIPNVSFWVRHDSQRFYVYAAWLNPIRVVYPVIARAHFWYSETLVEDDKFDLTYQIKLDIECSKRQLELQPCLKLHEECQVTGL